MPRVRRPGQARAARRSREAAPGDALPRAIASQAGTICQLGREAIDADRDGAQLDAGDAGDARKKGPPRRAAKAARRSPGPPDTRQGRRTPAHTVFP
jgi:hypothetical protein